MHVRVHLVDACACALGWCTCVCTWLMHVRVHLVDARACALGWCTCVCRAVGPKTKELESLCNRLQSEVDMLRAQVCVELRSTYTVYTVDTYINCLSLRFHAICRLCILVCTIHQYIFGAYVSNLCIVDKVRTASQYLSLVIACWAYSRSLIPIYDSLEHSS